MADVSEKKPLVIFSAGGKGTRIRSVDATVPKPMISIAGKPILQWAIENLVSQGYYEYIITVSYMAETIVDYFGNGERFGCNISYYYEVEPLGNAGALYKLWEEKRIEGSFFYFIADAIFSIDADRFFNYHKMQDSLATLFVHPNSHPYDSGIVIAERDGVVTDWLNKEDNRPEWYRNSVNAGLQILSTDLLKASEISPKDVGAGDGKRKVDLDRDVLKPMISTGKIRAYRSSEYCKDAGTPERFHMVESDIIAGRVEQKNLNHRQKAIFLDRDGTINKYVGFLRDLSEFELIDGVSEAIKDINNSGYLCIVVTNQPVIARGEVSWEKLDDIHSKLETLLGKTGAYVDDIYVCPHHPDGGFEGEVSSLKIKCDCRKPKPGMLLKAAQEYNIDLNQSWMIGDSWRDVEAGNAAGCKTVLLNGTGTESSKDGVDSVPDIMALNLRSAINSIIK